MRGDSGIADAIARGMDAQRARRRAAEHGGLRRLGWKLALNDPAVQRRLGLGGALVGALRADAVLAPGATLRAARGARLAVEAELALRIGPQPGPEPGAEAIASVAPALEIVDYALPAGDLETMVAHSFFHRAALFGEERPLDPGFDPADCVWTIRRNAETPRGIDGALLPESLGQVVRSLAALLRAHGEDLQPGDRVLCGSWVRPLRAGPGDVVRAEFGAWGGLELRIAPAE